MAAVCVKVSLFFFSVVAPNTSSPGHSHVLYRGYGQSQVGWHRETYCMVDSYRSYGDSPLATPAKVKAENPAPRQPIVLYGH